ncbi:hypothetical protein FGO68_gene5188 [Halteria grandinella]|uniref:Uncharacterized protein n=1 Tax=Halteria grandinella TaxID=5974 RepID=A0A8J8T0E5_HALGN|nr:hypothetical protein FGO68_gene5188 [Halteria grandinella]
MEEQLSRIHDRHEFIQSFSGYGWCIPQKIEQIIQTFKESIRSSDLTKGYDVIDGISHQENLEIEEDGKKKTVKLIVKSVVIVSQKKPNPSIPTPQPIPPERDWLARGKEALNDFVFEGIGSVLETPTAENNYKAVIKFSKTGQLGIFDLRTLVIDQPISE